MDAEVSHLQNPRERLKGLIRTGPGTQETLEMLVPVIFLRPASSAFMRDVHNGTRGGCHARRAGSPRTRMSLHAESILGGSQKTAKRGQGSGAREVFPLHAAKHLLCTCTTHVNIYNCKHNCRDTENNKLILSPGMSGSEDDRDPRREPALTVDCQGEEAHAVSTGVQAQGWCGHGHPISR